MIYLLPVVAYLLGSISSAVVIARLMGLQDPREVGSKNPGATNVLRYGGKLAAILTLAGDVLKGVIAVWIARYFTDDALVLAASTLAAFLGHLFPVFHGFKGGKGVATALGVWLGLSPWVALSLAAIWLATAVITRYSSLSALVASLAAPLVVAWLEANVLYIATMTLMSALLIWRHVGNIRKLLAGEEGKIGQKK
jgi:glycerol-3-phosphate acyltransferase PlsY